MENGTLLLRSLDDEAARRRGDPDAERREETRALRSHLELPPSFDTDASRKITVEMLLEHTSGLPLSILLGGELETFESLRQVADLAGARAPDFEPGSRFQYSDAGTDSLAALVEVVSGRSDRGIPERGILGPLAMKDAVLVMRETSPDARALRASTPAPRTRGSASGIPRKSPSSASSWARKGCIARSRTTHASSTCGRTSGG
jgi:CubicO group peptidase (beta-lactamase class C family)